MRVALALVSILSCISCSGQEQKTSELSKQQLEKIDRLFRDFDKKDSPGYTIGISKDTKTLYTKGYGSANLDYEIPITPSSAFDIASVSKQFTAACIALLIMEGKLTLETPIVEFIP